MSGERDETTEFARPGGDSAAGGLLHAPLFRLDPGWPFVIAGLALIVSAVLIPAQRELHDLEQQLRVHQAYEEKSKSEILAYEQFLADVQKGDPRLLERLLRAQLNKMPKDERPLLLMPTANDTVPQWIESSVTVEIPEPQPYPDTLLSRIASGPRRLWVLASGTFLVFMGILFVPSNGSRRLVRRPQPEPTPPVSGESVDPAESLAVAAACEGAHALEVGAEAEPDRGTDDCVEERSAETDVVADVVADAVVDDAAVCGADDEVAIVAEPDPAEGSDAACCEIETFPRMPAPPSATDRALDSLSLYSGIDDARWIDTRDPRS